MIGVCIPAHDEAERLGACLRSLGRAAHHPALAGEQVCVVVVLDACSDGTASVAALHGVRHIAIDARNVGVARAVGARFLLDRGARWLCCTDADTLVSPRWIVSQLDVARGADAVCGTVGTWQWHLHAERAEARRASFDAGYCDRDGHSHIHGANLGVSATAYRRVGGFAPLACSEDVALVRALLHSGAQVAFSARPRVRTSARPVARARGGFGDTVAALA